MKLGHVLKTPAGIAACVAVVAGVLLLLTLFMSWGQIVCVREPCPYPTGWQTLRVLDLPIALLGAAAAVVAALTLLGQTTRMGLVLALIGAAAVVLVLIAPLVERQDTPLFDFGGGWTIALFAAIAVLGSGLTIWVISSGVLEGEE
jgi:predicted small integral membrane protein